MRNRTELSVSIVLPVRNEAALIETALGRLLADFPDCELIVVDGASSDDSADRAGRLARVVSSPPGRAAQLNEGARLSQGDVLWFLHADTAIHPSALAQIRNALADPRIIGGGLTLRFDRPGAALAYVAWTSNLRARYLHWVFGDQAIFVRRHAFETLGGFPPLPIMEDLELSRRLHRHGRLALLPATATASARRFVEHGTWRMLAYMQYLKLLYFLGADPESIQHRYTTGPTRPKRHPARRKSAQPTGDLR